MQPDSHIHWSTYPALLVAATFAVGTALEVSLSIGLGGWLGVAGAGVGGMAGASVRERSRLFSLAPLARVGSLAVLAVAAGGARTAAIQSPPPRSVAVLAATAGETGLDAVVAGTIADPPEQRSGSWRFTLAVSTIRRADAPPAAAIDATGRLRATLHNPLWISTPSYPTLREGDRVELQGTFRPAPGPRNPGGFDYGAYLHRRGICCTLFVQTPAGVRVLGDTRSSLQEITVRGRAYVDRHIRRFVPSDASGGILRALLLGNRSSLTGQQQEQFVDTGLMHLLAVSGLHVLLVGMILYRLLRPLLMRVRLPRPVREGARAILTIGVLLFYMLLTGARPSVVRAVVMASVFIGGLLIQRSPHTLNSLGVAALLLLMHRPLALFDAGFQLSMTAVTGIITLHPRLSERIPEAVLAHPVGGWASSLLSVSVAATLGTGPVLLAHFGQAQIGGVVLNLPAIPLTAAGLTAGILCVLAGGVLSGAAAAFGTAADVFLRALLHTAQWGAVWFNWGLLAVPGLSLFVLSALASLLAMGAQWPRPRLRWRLGAASLAFLCLWAWTPVLSGESRSHLDVVFLDVGHGDAILISTPGNRHFLVDTGPRSHVSDAGRRVLLPVLQHWGIRTLDAVVITHPDSDHLGGLPTLLREVDVRSVLTSGWEASTELFEESRRVLDRLSVPYRPAVAGEILEAGGGLVLQVLAPPPGGARPLTFHENDASVVLRMGFGSTRWLLTGDVEEAGEQWLVRRYGGMLSSHVVKVPHHGSSTSSGIPFVERVSQKGAPLHAVVSVGRHGRFGLPNSDVLSRWERYGAIVHSTSRQGAVWLRTDGEEIWRIPWRE